MGDKKIDSKSEPCALCKKTARIELDVNGQIDRKSLIAHIRNDLGYLPYYCGYDFCLPPCPSEELFDLHHRYSHPDEEKLLINESDEYLTAQCDRIMKLTFANILGSTSTTQSLNDYFQSVDATQFALRIREWRTRVRRLSLLRSQGKAIFNDEKENKSTMNDDLIKKTIDSDGDGVTRKEASKKDEHEKTTTNVEISKNGDELKERTEITIQQEQQRTATTAPKKHVYAKYYSTRLVEQFRSPGKKRDVEKPPLTILGKRAASSMGISISTVRGRGGIPTKRARLLNGGSRLPTANVDTIVDGTGGLATDTSSSIHPSKDILLTPTTPDPAPRPSSGHRLRGQPPFLESKKLAMESKDIGIYAEEYLPVTEPVTPPPPEDFIRATSTPAPPTAEDMMTSTSGTNTSFVKRRLGRPFGSKNSETQGASKVVQKYGYGHLLFGSLGGSIRNVAKRGSHSGGPVARVLEAAAAGGPTPILSAGLIRPNRKPYRLVVKEGDKRERVWCAHPDCSTVIPILLHCRAKHVRGHLQNEGVWQYQCLMCPKKFIYDDTTKIRHLPLHHKIPEPIEGVHYKDYYVENDIAEKHRAMMERCFPKDAPTIRVEHQQEELPHDLNQSTASSKSDEL